MKKLFLRTQVLFLSLVVVSYSLNLTARTKVSGGIYADTTWTLANSFYAVTGRIMFSLNAFLTIGPDGAVKFKNNRQPEIQRRVVIRDLSSYSTVFISASQIPINEFHPFKTWQNGRAIASTEELST